MSTLKMNKHECQAVAAWANPNQKHDLESFSEEYVLQQLAIAAADGDGPGAKLLNEDGIQAKLQILAEFRDYAQLLTIQTHPTIEDLKSLVRLIYQMDQMDLFDFSEFEDFEKAGPSDRDTESLAAILLGKLCEHHKLRLPKAIPPETLYYELHRLYSVTAVLQDQRNRSRVQPPSYSSVIPPAFPNLALPSLHDPKRLLPVILGGRAIRHAQRPQQRRSIWARAWGRIKSLKP